MAVLDTLQKHTSSPHLAEPQLTLEHQPAIPLVTSHYNHTQNRILKRECWLTSSFCSQHKIRNFFCAFYTTLSNENLFPPPVPFKTCEAWALVKQHQLQT